MTARPMPKPKTLSADNPEDLGEMMRAWRRYAGLNTEEAGEWLGLSARTIEGIEQGRGFNAPRVLAWALVGLRGKNGVGPASEKS